MILNRMRTLLWRMDPGQFLLKQGAKTILAILISLWLMRQEPLVSQLMAAVASGFSMQGVIAKTWLLRVLHVSLFIFGYTITFAVGLLVRDKDRARNNFLFLEDL